MANIILKALCLPLVALIMISAYMTTRIDWHDDDWLLMICILASMVLSTAFALIIWLREIMMDNELYCPMKMTSNPLGRCVCEKEKCAWWRQLDGCCAVWQIAWKLDNIETKMKR